MTESIRPTSGATSMAPTVVAVPQPAAGAEPAPQAAVSSFADAVSRPAARPTRGSAEGTENSATVANLEGAKAQVRDFLKQLPPELQYKEDEGSGYVVFKVVNPVTKEVIRQFPPDEILALARRLKALDQGGTGVLFDEKS